MGMPPTIIYRIQNVSYQLLEKQSFKDRCSLKKVFLEITQNSQENNCARVSFLIKLQAWYFRMEKQF